MQQVKIKNKVFSELRKLALRKDLRLSQVVESLIKNQGKLELRFNGDFDPFQERLYSLGVLCIMLPQLGTEDLQELVVNLQEKNPAIFSKILSQENNQNQEKNQSQNEH